jgi:cobalt-zinc-cadmium efflux system membrane fusion protein
VGQPVVLESLQRDYSTIAKIDWISPLAMHASQSVHARVIVPNTDDALRPGQFVRAHVTVAENMVPLAVRQSALQRFRDHQVVFVKFDETYEVRMLKLGRSNREWVEVLDGIDPGNSYVTDNSYLIKADIEKSGAGHDH